MKKALIALALGLFLTPIISAQTYSWRWGEHDSAMLNGETIVWQIVADPAQGKPYFHPLDTLSSTALTDLRPPDHPWHRGLWFSWKFMNGRILITDHDTQEQVVE